MITYKSSSTVSNDFFSVSIDVHVVDNELPVIQRLWVFSHLRDDSELDTLLGTIYRNHDSWLDGRIKTTMNNLKNYDARNLQISIVNTQELLKRVEAEIIQILISNKYYSIDSKYKDTNGNVLVYVGKSDDGKHWFRNTDGVIVDNINIDDSTKIKKLKLKYPNTFKNTI